MMAGELSLERLPARELDDLWAPSPWVGTWLAAALAALMIDLVLGIAVTGLELANWGKDGITSDVVLSYVAIVPQACVFLTFLVLARELGDRGLWKSTAGLFASYLLASLIGIALLDGMPRGGVVAINVVAAAGIVALLWFSLSKWPRFEPATKSGAASPTETITLPRDTDSTESEGGGWIVHVVVGLGLVALKYFGREMNRGLPNIDLGLDGWTLLATAIAAAFALGFLVWFALAKIRLRHTLGGLAAVVGSAELLILLLHTAMLAFGIYLFTAAVAANPLLDEDAIDRLLDPWLMRATVVSAGCHAVWVVLTATLMASLWLRPQGD